MPDEKLKAWLTPDELTADGCGGMGEYCSGRDDAFETLAPPLAEARKEIARLRVVLERIVSAADLCEHGDGGVLDYGRLCFREAKSALKESPDA